MYEKDIFGMNDLGYEYDTFGVGYEDWLGRKQSRYECDTIGRKIDGELLEDQESDQEFDK